MKGGEVAWIDDLPQTWSATRVKFCASKIGSGVTPRGGSETYKSEGIRLLRSQNVYDDGLRLDDVAYIDIETDILMSRSRLQRDDVLLNITGASIGRTCIVPEDVLPANVNQHVCIIRPLRGVSARYLSYALKSTIVREQILRDENGSSREGLNYAQVGDLRVPRPGLSEQISIADFLDRQTTAAADLLTKYRDLLKVTEEKRAAVISHTVSGGLNPDSPTKESGSPWLGKIPAHWQTSPLARLTPDSRKIMYGIVLPGPNVDQGISIVKGGDVKPERLNLESLSRTTLEIESAYRRARLRSGDLVYAIRGSIGEVEIVPPELDGVNITQDAARISPKSGVSNRWLRYALKSTPVFAQLDAAATGATIRGINIWSLKRAVLAVPPRDEQDMIADFLDNQLSHVDALLNKVRLAMATIAEHKSALITAAVTGRSDISAFEEITGEIAV